MNVISRDIEFQSVSVLSIERKTFRLDASFYRGAFADASRRLELIRTCAVAEVADAFVPGRTRLVTTRSSKAGAPYLRAHDAFDIRPRTGRFVSKARTKHYDELLLNTPSRSAITVAAVRRTS